MDILEQHRIFEGLQLVVRHHAETLSCDMNVGIFLPPDIGAERLPVLYWLSGLTCNEQNFITKAGAQQYAARYRVILVAPDSSPRGEQVADDEAYDLGQGAGFYVNATKKPWSEHYQMYDYIVHELRAFVDAEFPANGIQSIMGHSAGGHGALTIGLRNPDIYRSISVFSPITAPSQAPWGRKAFNAYLGSDETTWAKYDAVSLIRSGTAKIPVLADQGSEDPFLAEQLQPALLAAACKEADFPLILNLREGYDHSYYFIASFIESHIRFHMKHIHG